MKPWYNYSQSVDLEDILTDSGIRGQEELQVQQTGLQEPSPIKEESEGMGLEYTGYSPDYSLYQRDYVATGEGEAVETGRSRYVDGWCLLVGVGLRLLVVILARALAILIFSV